MLARTLPGAEELFSEFQSVTINGKTFIANGDCGEFAELSAVHIVTGLPFTDASLQAILQREVSANRASLNGAEPLISIAEDLDVLKLIYHLYNYPGPSDWLEILSSNAGIQPVIMEIANGQNLAGDEAGLHYHFITIVGVTDNGNYLCCDGDNTRRDAERVLCEYTPTMIDGAQPCGMIVVKYPQNDPYGYRDNGDGSITYNHSGITLSHGVAEFVKTHNVQEECLYPETYYDGSNYSVTPFTNSVTLVWSEQDKAILLNHAGEVIAKLLLLLKA